MLHLVQYGLAEEELYDEEAEEWEDKVKKNEEHLKKLESEKKKKREQYEGELGVVLWNSVNTMQADLDTHTCTRLGQYLSPCPPHTVCVLWGNGGWGLYSECVVC